MIDLKKQIKRLIYDGHLELSKYYSLNFKSFVLFLFDRLFYSRFKDIEIIHLNFLVTSKAELRVFKPIINYLLNRLEGSEVYDSFKREFESENYWKNCFKKHFLDLITNYDKIYHNDAENEHYYNMFHILLDLTNLLAHKVCNVPR